MIKFQFSLYFCIRIYIFNLYNKYRTPSRKVAHEQHQHPVFYPRFIKSHRIRCAFSFIPYPSNPLRNISPVFKARFRGFSRVCVSSAFVPRGNPREFSWNSRIISGARDGVWTNFIHELRFQRSFLRKQEIRLARERAFLLVIERAASHGGGNPVTLNGLVARFILSGVAEDGETTISLYNVFFNLVYSRKFGEL